MRYELTKVKGNATVTILNLLPALMMHVIHSVLVY
jgi:hypothetical protein